MSRGSLQWQKLPHGATRRTQDVPVCSRKLPLRATHGIRPGAIRSVPWRQLYGYFNIKSGIFLLRHSQFFCVPKRVFGERFSMAYVVVYLRVL